MKEYLDSDRLNFLIWRYLIEGNYRETAVKFQKEWHITAPHRHFDFAPYVRSHALVNTLNKGLLYNALEREYQSQSEGASVAEATEAQHGVFGPLVAQPPRIVDDGPPTQVEAEERESEGLENSRKRQIDTQPQQQQHLPNGSPAKRPRLSNGYENGVETVTTPMEIDQNHNLNGDNNHAYPSPLEGEQVPTPIPRTDGPEQGTQVEKVEELATETMFIPLGADHSATSPSPALGETAFAMNGENAPVLLHCQWNPQDPTILAAAGTDALARIWTISRGLSDPASGHVNGVVPPYHCLIEDNVPKNSTVTAMAWNWEGSNIAIATETGVNEAHVSVWGTDGRVVDHFEVGDPPVIKLRWSPNDGALLGIAPGNDGAIVTVYGPSGTASYSFMNHDLAAEPLDATWISETDFLICGGQLLISLRYADGTITEIRTFETRDDDNLTQVHFDWRSSLAATCGEKGIVDIWDQSGARRSVTAHLDNVTAIAWQPLQTAPPDDERLIASAGEDHQISIWNARSPESKPRYDMTMEGPIVALAFTPDGAFIAGATSDRILIWKVGEPNVPRASWSRAPHPGWSSPRMSAMSDEEDEHCLCWDANGQKLAFGVNSRLAVINFR